MSRIATMARNYRKVGSRHKPSETVMIATGWRYSVGESQPTQFRQCRTHRIRHGLAQLSLGRAFQTIKRRTWERLDVETEPVHQKH